MTEEGATWPTAGDAARRGVVSEFDDDRGLGTVTDEDGMALPFHCTAILDGSRFIEVGTEVLYDAAPGHLGRVEARRLRTLR